MQIPDEIRLASELIGLVGVGGMIMFRLGRLGERFDTHATKMDKVETAIDKIQEAMATVAVQKNQIQTIADQVAQNTKRTDETFARVFTLLDRLQDHRPREPAR